MTPTEAPTETTQKPQKEPETIADDTETTAEGKEPGKATDDAQKGKKEMIYKYGMRLRGFSIGCQPAGVVERLDDTTGKYWDIITYNRPLTGEEMRTYGLDDLNDNKTNRILTEYAAQYERLYNSNNSKLEQSASTQFDAYAEENKDFISEICNVKGDFISSDREAAALMIALVKLGYAKTKRLDTSREEKTAETTPESAETAVKDKAKETQTEDKKDYVETYTQPSTGQKIAVEEIGEKYNQGYKNNTKTGGFNMWIKGFVHQTEEEAFLADVHIVKDIRFSAGEYVGYMELSNSDEIVIVKEHPGGGMYNGQIVKEAA